MWMELVHRDDNDAIKRVTRRISSEQRFITFNLSWFFPLRRSVIPTSQLRSLYLFRLALYFVSIL